METVPIEARWLSLLHTGLVRIRACAREDPARAAAIADALHNVPLHLSRGTFDESFFRSAFAEGLVSKYPDEAWMRRV